MKNFALSTLLFFAAGLQANAADYYNVVAKHSNKCLHQFGGTQANGGAITQWDCVDQPNVKLEIIPVGGYNFLRFQHSGKCVHQHGGTQANGDAITQWDCMYQPNVLWKLVPVGN
jgi:hypothetical protein